MKKIFITLSFALLTLLSMAQVANSVNYQAYIRNASNELVRNQAVSVGLFIVRGSITNGPVVYKETHDVVTTQDGIVNLEIGTGESPNDFSAIEWGTAPHFLTTRIDIGDGYVEMGSVQFSAVPYALYAEKAGNVEELISRLETLETAANSTLIDIEGNVYKTVQVGDQVWMAENLRTRTLNDGTSIDTLNGNWSEVNDKPLVSFYNNDPMNLLTHGALYNRISSVTSNLCPTGWHVPASTELDKMVEFLGGSVDIGLKTKANWGWSNSTGITNSSGLSFTSSGSRYRDTYGSKGLICYFRTVDGIYYFPNNENTNTLQKYQVFNSATGEFAATGGASIRCIKD